MKTRDQAEAGDDDPGKTTQLDETYRVRLAAGGQSRDSEKGALLRVPVHLASNETLPLDDQWRQAELTGSARAEFKSAAAAVIDRIKAGEDLPKPELDREWNARLQLLAARQFLNRLGHLRKAFRATEEERLMGESK